MKKTIIILAVTLFYVANSAFAQNASWAIKSSLTTNSTLIGARFAPVGFGINGKGYYGTGSANENSNTRFNDFWRYDPITDRWTQVANKAGSAVSSAFAFALNGIGYVGGGMINTNTVTNDFYSYSPGSNSWFLYGTVPNVPGSTVLGRAGAMACVV
jgi:N-acetylneuraminic acid mutarotase